MENEETLGVMKRWLVQLMGVALSAAAYDLANKLLLKEFLMMRILALTHRR